MASPSSTVPSMAACSVPLWTFLSERIDQLMLALERTKMELEDARCAEFELESIFAAMDGTSTASTCTMMTPLKESIQLFSNGMRLSLYSPSFLFL